VFPQNTELAFMTFVVDVQPDKRTLLGAVTHVDGSARIQTVSQSGNPRFHRLLTEFKALTGLPVLLNTSFNNNAEPIVDSADDAIVCFLTTGLDRLVLGDFVISKREVTPDEYLAMTVTVLPHVKLMTAHRPYTQTDEHYMSLTSDPLFSAPLGADLHALLEIADGKRTVRELLAAAGFAGAKADAAVLELRELWSRRLVALAPEQPS
jgi:carbamoyltransferase